MLYLKKRYIRFPKSNGLLMHDTSFWKTCSSRDEEEIREYNETYGDGAARDTATRKKSRASESRRLGARVDFSAVREEREIVDAVRSVFGEME